MSIVSRGPNQLDLFARGSDSAVWHKALDGGWQPWESLGGNTDTAIAACSWGGGRLDIFYRDKTSLRLNHKYKNGTGSWVTAQPVGTSTIPQSAPTAAAWGDQHIDIFMKGTSSDLRHIWFAGTWAADWITETGTANTLGSAPSAVSWGPNRLDLFWKDNATSRLQHWWYDGAFHPLDLQGGETLASAPGATSRGGYLLDVFFLSSTNTNTLAHTYLNGAFASEDFALNGAVTPPAAASWGPSRVDIVYQTANGDVQHTILPSAPVLTQKGDNTRAGANLNEQELNTSNVASAKFGQLFEIPVDGNVYAQPLFVPTLNLGAAGIHNVLYIATANNSVYMADADTGAVLNRIAFSNPVPMPFRDFVPSLYGLCLFNSLPQVGIVSTPVIDLASKTLYVTTLRAEATLSPEEIPADNKCQPAPNTPPMHTYKVELHALDLVTLTERSGSPKQINPTAGSITFDPRHQMQRPGLLLSNGIVYVAFGSYMDLPPFFGWVVGFDATTLAQRYVFVTAPNADPARGGGGIWNSGQAPAADASGNIYLLTGNLLANGYNGINTPNSTSNPLINNFAGAALKLTPALTVASYFIPWNQTYQNVYDMDLGSGGLALVPGTNYVIGGGKEGVVYLLDRDNLGGFNQTADQVVYEDLATRANAACADQKGLSNVHATPVLWNAPSGLRFYLWGEEDVVRSYTISGGAYEPTAQSAARAPCGMPGGVLSLSANKGVGGTGIIWGTVPTQDSLTAVVPGKIYAFNAESMQQLWSADFSMSDARHAKFAVSTVANGRVYVPAFGPANSGAGRVLPYSGKVIVYGLKSK